ncbi:MAG: efflux RND transporter periplasmic adaptor subunit [Deltaproteobacteria bacterium]|nr:efflux RND transporter periplasmic adaptor subunit [Deltaproteobacteria bacterium]
MIRHRIVSLAVVLILAAGCRAPGPGDESQEVAPVMVVAAAPATITPMISTLRVLGVTVANHHVTIRAPAAGRLTGISLKNGDQVRRGERIGYVVNREVEAAQAGLAIARKLDPQGANALAESINRYDKGAGIPIIAPEAGVVSRPPITSGQMVADLDPIVELIDPSSIYVEASIPVDELHLVSPGMPATVTSGLKPGVAFAARVGAMIPSFDASSATTPVRLDFTGPETIQEIGAPVEARIVTSDIPDALAIPATALFQDVGQNHYHVFVAGPDGRAHRVNVTIGVHDGPRVQVLDGIKAGDQVITSGGYALSDGLKIRIAGAPS